MAMGLPFEGEQGPDTRIGAVADRAVATCEVDAAVAHAGSGDLCVVLDRGVVAGLLDAEALGADPSTPVVDVMAPGPSTFRPSLPIEEMAAYFDEHDLDRTLVTTLDGRLVGVVRRGSL
jgi:Mg/Co/Ni transporter MgtE